MIPIISEKRTISSDGLWSNKMCGDFEDGDSSLTKFIIEGHADIKELGGHLRIFFKDVLIRKRPFILTDEIKHKLLLDFREEKRRKKRAAFQLSESDPVSDSDEDDDEEEKQEKEKLTLERLVTLEKMKQLEIPKLTLYLTTKRPKTRMVDAHKQGTKIRLTDTIDGEFGAEDVLKTYESSLTDIPDALSYQGLVVLKLPEAEPVTNEPIIYGLIKLQSYRTLKIKTSDALHLADISEELAKVMVCADKKPVVKNSATLASTTTDVEANNPDNFSELTERVKPLHVYRKISSKIWLDFQKTNDEQIDFTTFLQFLDHLDLFMVTTQARRIFDAVDLEKDGFLGMSEFENFLIANDILDSPSLDLVVLDVFDSLKAFPASEVMRRQELAATKKNNSSNGNKADKEQIATASGDPLQLVSNGNDDVKDKKKSKLAKQIEVKEGLDYSSFLEGVQMLGVKQDDNDVLREAFCFAGGIKEKDADKKIIDLNEFRKGWLKLSDVVAELKKRGLKYDRGLLVDSRNRELLTRSQVQIEETYLNNLMKINDVVEQVKRDRRMKSDQKRREQEQFKEKLVHEANKFIAVRAQEKRLKLKQEQEEKSKKRIEDKVLRNKLELRQQENLELTRNKILESNKKREKLRNDEIVALGLDKLDLSVQQLRVIPQHLYNDQEAQLKLSYVIFADLSRNVLEQLPNANFLYWMSEARKLKLSENRIKVVPNDVQQMVKLEILELDTNRLQSLPHTISKCSMLTRLDLSNNHLENLPDELGDCISLKYLRIHSNYLKTIPKTIGGCTRLEYIDVSRNNLIELPDGLQYLLSLIHLDVSSNSIASFPTKIGKCMSLSYLDASINQLTYLPESFADLEALEYCNLDNNSIVTTPNTFNQLMSLKKLTMHMNSARTLYPDFGCMLNIIKLDISVNSIQNLPLEIGRLKFLQELNLHRNQLVTLPLEMGSLISLQKLDLSYNLLNDCISESIGLITSLVDLNLSFNQIERLPRSIVGLQQLVSINMERCLLTDLPDTITYLSTLEILELSNNRFTRFPIELHNMKSLKKLSLSNNSLTLLPRQIDLMTNLTDLNLSRNQLRALPVEFTDVLESVHVQLHSNPWSDWPPRWGKLWPDKHSVQGSSHGYTLADAVDFLYAMRSFYSTAEQIWEELGVFHYTQKLNLEDFIQELRDRIPISWHEGLTEYVKYIYFVAKKSGIFPRWYVLSEAVEKENKLRLHSDMEKREKSVIDSKQEVENRQLKLNIIYNDNLTRKARHTLERSAEHEKNQEVKQRIALSAIKSSASNEEKISTRRVEVRERQFAKLQHKETTRLQDILSADKEGREIDRKERKNKYQLPFKLSEIRHYGHSS